MVHPTQDASCRQSETMALLAQSGFAVDHCRQPKREANSCCTQTGDSTTPANFTTKIPSDEVLARLVVEMFSQ